MAGFKPHLNRCPDGITLEIGTAAVKVLAASNMGGEAVKVMRRQFVSFAILSLLAAVPRAEATVDDGAVPRVSAPVAVQSTNIPVPWIRDEAAMVLVGTALLGLAAAVRRAA